MRAAGAPGIGALRSQPAGLALARAGIMLAGLALALALRLDVAGGLGTGHLGSGYRPIAAGLVFALALFAIAWAARGPRWSGSDLIPHRHTGRVPRNAMPVATNAGGGALALAWGILGAAVLVSFPLGFRLSGAIPGTGFPFGDFPLWASIVTLVAVAEEVLLRGVLFAAVEEALGTVLAVVVTAAAFALVHVPLYGPTVLPLDCAVGIWLGTLRVVSRSVVAPATAHTLADLVAWWLA